MLCGSKQSLLRLKYQENKRVLSPILHEGERLGTQRPSNADRREMWLVFAGLTLLYLLAIAVGNRRYVWFDELFTFDIARSASLQQLWYRLGRFDSNPPGVYLLSRLSMSIFGPGPLGLRLPSMVEFYIGSMAMLVYVRRKANMAFAALAVLLVWTVAPTLYYAVEARPYALLFASFTALLLSWDTAIRATSRRLALAGIAICTLTLALAHVFALFTVVAFLAAEAVRFLRRRQRDYAVWLAFVLPMLAMLLYIPLIRLFGGVVLAIHASFLSMRSFYEDLLGSPLVAYVLLTVVLLVPLTKNSGETLRRKFEPEEITLFGCVCLIPILINLMLMHRKATFYPRYCVTTQAAILMALAILLAYRSGLRRLPAYVASLLLVAFILKFQVIHPMLYPVPSNAAFLASVHPELPLVVGEGEVFMEMNHHEGPTLLARLYFLKDRQAALKYAKSNMFHAFEAPDDLRNAGFPITAQVASYSNFVHQHHQFLLLGDPGQWVFARLKPDGASIAIVDNYADQMPYFDTKLYLVTMPPN